MRFSQEITSRGLLIFTADQRLLRLIPRLEIRAQWISGPGAGRGFEIVLGGSETLGSQLLNRKMVAELGHECAGPFPAR